MFLIKFKDVESGCVNHIVTKLDNADMTAYVHTLYEKTKDFSENLTNYQVNDYVIDLRYITEDNFDVDDFILSVIESEYCPIIKLPKDEEMLELFQECVELYQLKYLEYEMLSLLKEPELDNILDYAIIDEVFNGISNLTVFYSPMSYLTVIDVDGEYLRVNGETHRVTEFRWEELFNYIDVESQKKLNDAEYLLSKYLISPIPFTLIPKEDIIERVNNYKSKVFYMATQLTARDISKLPKEVSNIFTTAGYVPQSTVNEHKETIERLIS